MPQLKFYLFGYPRLELDGQLTALSLRKAYGLLAFLAVTGQPHGRDSLATLLWPEANQRTARANLRRMVYSVARRFECPLLATTPETIELNPATDLWLDVDVFMSQIQLASGQPHESSALIEAVELYSDDFMAGFNLDDCPEFDEWQFFQREELRQQLAIALLRLVDRFEAAAEYEAALPYARRWLALDNLHEPAHRRLMALYARAGQQAAAQRQYDECIKILAEELDAPPEEETRELFEAIRTRRFAAPLTKSSSGQDGSSSSKRSAMLPVAHADSQPIDADRNPRDRIHNLPAPTSPFIGRSQEIEEIFSRLTDPACRLLTLIGPGGIGKTRLALEVATQASNAGPTDPHFFRDGVYFVSLRPVTEVTNIVSAIATGIGLRLFENRSSREQLLDHLADKQMLLLLDNFEHLLDGLDLLTELMTAALSVKLLITSRDALHLQEAWFHPVAGMVFPKVEMDEGTDVEYDAVRLFEQAARRTQVNFTLARERAHVVRICQLVEGMPLALELAAAWLKVLSPAEVADEIERNLDILVAQYEDLPERHRSVRTVFLQSWKRLAEQEQNALMRLAVFRGGCDRAAADEVAGAGLPVLSRLVDGGLVQRTQGGRYDLHELLRQFLREKVAEDGLIDDLRNAHCEYYFQQLQEQESAIFGVMPKKAIDILKAELDNLRQAWNWAIDEANWALINSVIEPFSALHDFTGLLQEAAHLFTGAVKKLTPRSTQEGENSDDIAKTMRHLHTACAMFLSLTGEPEQALNRIRTAISVMPQGLDIVGEARANLVKIEILDLLGEFHKMLMCARETLGLIQACGDTRLKGKALNLLSWANYRNHQPEAALTYAQRAADLYAAANNRYGQALSLGYVALAHYQQEKREEGLVFDHQALQIFEDLDAPVRVAYTTNNMGVTYLQLGRYDKAIKYTQRALDIHRRLGNRAHEASTMENLGEIQLELEHHVAAEETLLAALRISLQVGVKQVECGVRYKLGRLYIALEDYAEAAQQLEMAHALAIEIQDQILVALSLGEQGTLHHRTGDVEKALQLYERAITELKKHWRIAVPQFLLQKAALLLEQARIAEAETALNEGMEAIKVSKRNALLKEVTDLQAKIYEAQSANINT